MVVLLRGINVGGKNRLPMAELRSIAAELGFAGAVTHLQSGNLVLPAVTASPAQVASALTAAIRDRVGLDLAIVTRTASQWAAVVSANPFRRESADGTKVHVVFLEAEATDGVRDLDAEPFAPESLVVSGSELYLSLPNGLGRSRLASTLSRVHNANTGTTRNWNTVVALADLVTPSSS